MEILLTNDDGVDAPGLAALADALADLGEVIVVAPVSDQSAVGRGLSYGRMGPEAGNEGTIGIGEAGEAGDPFAARIPYADHELGYAVHGTPCDCVIAGVRTFDPDVVVAGCNPGANLGVHVLPRSGTASAAAEAACLGTPGVAVSMDGLGEDRSALGPADFERACRVGRDVVDRALKGGAFGHADYLNVNVPGPSDELTGLEVTHPTPVYDMEATRSETTSADGAVAGAFQVRNPLWAGMAAGEIPDEEGTDRRALLAGRASVSPLTVRSANTGVDDLAGLFDGLV